MRITILFFLLSFVPIFLSAQNEAVDLEAKTVAQKWASTYKLDGTQQAQMLNIQSDYFEKLKTLEAIKESNYDLYLTKRKGLRQMRMNATYAMLSSNQKNIYDQIKVKKQKEISALKAEMKKSGATVDEIKRAVMEIEE